MTGTSCRTHCTVVFHGNSATLPHLLYWYYCNGYRRTHATSSHDTVDGTVTLSLTGDKISASHLEQFLDPERHPFTFDCNMEIDQSGTFTPVSDEDFSMVTFSPQFEARFVSFAVEKELDVFWFSTKNSFQLYAPRRIAESDDFVRELLGLALLEESYMFAQQSQGKS
jgi:hypothetical protein